MKIRKRRTTPHKKTQQLRRDYTNAPVLKVSQVKIHSILTANGVQASLRTASPYDPHEQQADHIANNIMSKPNNLAPLRRHKKASLSEQITSLQAPRHNTNEDKLSEGPNSSIRQRLDSFKGTGQPLVPSEQHFFESRFGSSFNQVRIHNNDYASQTAHLLQARAFTHGNDVVFAKGEYTQGTTSGRRLLAHELTHVVQQTKHKSTTVQKMADYTNDKHDLQSSRFSGNTILEAVYDKQQYIHTGSRGDHVAIAQQALEDAGSTLPKYGADGIFGSETFRAVVHYQSNRGLQKDGIIGSLTIGDLDSLFSGGNKSDKNNKKKACGGIHSLKHSFFNHVDVVFFIVRPCKTAKIKISGEWQGASNNVSGPEHFPIILDSAAKRNIKAGHKGGGQFPRIPGKNHFFSFTLAAGKHKLRLSTGGINIGQPDSLKIKLHTKGNLKVN